MALIKLNLAQGVTGTLPNANFSGGKVLQTQQSLFTSGSNHSTESGYKTRQTYFTPVKKRTSQ
jgi:hypothetical protein